MRRLAVLLGLAVTAALAVVSVTPAFFVALMAGVVVYPVLGWLTARESSA